MAKLSSIALVTVLNGIVTYLVPLVALVLLPPADYGRFSLVYLIYALGTSLSMSLLNEPWARAGAKWDQVTTRAFATLTGVLALGSSLLGALVAAGLSIGLREVGLAGLGLGFAILRFCHRYRHLALGATGRAVVADLLGVLVSGGLYSICFALEATGLGVVFGGWAAGMFVACLPVWVRGSGIRAAYRFWRDQYRTQVLLLVRDSAISNLAMIGAPYVISPILGLTQFGVYRAVSNLVAPIRVLVAGVRPLLIRIGPVRLVSPRFSTAIVLAAVLAGLAAGTALVHLSRSGMTIGSLSAVSVYYVPVGLLTAATLVSQLYIATARVFAPSRLLLRARLVQASMTGLAPVVGAAATGLDGAIWGYTIAYTLGACIWLCATTWSVSRAR